MAVKSHKASGLLCAWGACPCVRRTLTPTHPPQDAGTPLWGPVGPLAGNGSVALDKSPPGWAGTTGEMQALTMARRPGRSLEPPILGPGWGGGAVWKPTASGFQAEDVQTWGGGQGSWLECGGAAQGSRGLADGIPGALGPAAVSPSPPGRSGAMPRIPAWPGALPRGENSTILALGLSHRAARGLEAGGMSPFLPDSGGTPPQPRRLPPAPAGGHHLGSPKGEGVGCRSTGQTQQPGLVTSTQQVEELGLPRLLGVRVPVTHETPRGSPSALGTAPRPPKLLHTPAAS